MRNGSFVVLILLTLELILFTSCSESKDENTLITTEPKGTVKVTQAMLDTNAEEPIGEKDSFKGLTIGFSQRDLQDSNKEWYGNLIRVAKAEADHLGIKLIVLDGESNLSKQVADIESLISEKVDAIILNPQDSISILPAVKQIHEANIPLTVVNSALDPAGEPFTFVATDAFKTGYKSGMELAKAVDERYGWRESIKAVVLSANQQESESDQRRWGQLSGYNDYMIQKYGKSNLDIIAFDYYKWRPEEASKRMKDILKEHKDIDVIFNACDGGTQGVISALKEEKLLGKILITSIDGRKNVLQWIMDGDKGIVATVSNDPRLMGKWSVYFAAHSAKGYMTPDTFYVPNPAINIGNVYKYLDLESKY